MNTVQTFRVAVRALLRNKMRSFLTTLGIVIGVAAVIAMVAIGEGAKALVERTFASMGSNLVLLLPGTTTRGGVFGGFGSMPTLTWGDLAAIKADVPTVRYAVAAMRTTAPVQSSDQNWTTSINGTSPDYFAMRSWPVAEGSLFTQADVDGVAKVVVLGRTVVNELYGSGFDPVGQMVRIRNVPFEVIGVLARKGQSPMGQDYDDAVFMPETTYMTRIQGGLQQYIPGVILVSARSAADTARAEEQIREVLRDRHHLAPGTDDDFSIRNLTELASAQEQGTRTLTVLLASIAAVSLLVGGIGIMNIMLVSVTERTREIGLRMAVGAKPRAILAQFLVEASTLSLAGSFIGVVIGLVVAASLAARLGWPMLVRPDVIAIAVVFSALVGAGFGIYPARRASLLEPIEALRFE